MLSKYFENTKPITFIIVLIALLIGDGLYQFQILQQPLKVGTHLIFLSISLTLLLFSLVLLHQIDRWNELTETKNSYSIAFFSILVVLFPALFDNMKLVGANLLIIMASTYPQNGRRDSAKIIRHLFTYYLCKLITSLGIGFLAKCMDFTIVLRS